MASGKATAPSSSRSPEEAAENLRLSLSSFSVTNEIMLSFPFVFSLEQGMAFE